MLADLPLAALPCPGSSQRETLSSVKRSHSQAFKLISGCCCISDKPSPVHNPSCRDFPVNAVSSTLCKVIIQAFSLLEVNLVQSLELKVLLSVVSELSLLIEYLRRFSSICNKKKSNIILDVQETHLSTKSLLSLRISTLSYPSTSQYLPSHRHLPRGLKTGRKQSSKGFFIRVSVSQPAFPSPRRTSEYILTTQLCMAICLRRIHNQWLSCCKSITT